MDDTKPEIEITPEMVERWRAEFEGWFSQPQHSEGLVEMPSYSSTDELLFLALRVSSNPTSFMNFPNF